MVLASLDVCRLCAQKKKIKLDLFSGDGALLQKIVYSLALTIMLEDPLPKMVCFECQRNVEQLHSFKVKCLRAQDKLNSIISGQGTSKSLPIVKEEIEQEQEHTEQRPHTTSCPTSEHNYFAVLAPTHTTGNVKTELIFPLETPEDEEGYNSDVIFEEFVYERTSHDVKQPIIEVVVENYENIIQNVEDGSKVEIDTAHFEAKPSVEVTVEETPKPPKRSRRKIIDKKLTDEFCDQDLMLREDEECNVDMELIEATIMKKADPDMRFKCSKCKKSFKFFNGLRKHRSVHEVSDPAYACNFCLEEKNVSYEFASLKTLQKHLFTKHLRDAEYPCKICSQQFRTRNEHKHHMKNTHAPAYKCRVCAKNFKLKSILTAHLKVHSDIKAYVCNECGQKFRWPSPFQYHLQAHHNQEKNYLCSECGNKFSSRRSLLDHINVHRGVKPYSCSHCALSFAHISSLKKHQNVHKSLKLTSFLKARQVDQSGGRTFSCHVCFATFTSKCNLCNHLKIHGEKRHVCEECGMKFSRSHQLNDHMVRHTGRKHKCPAPDCDKSYTQRYPLTKHFRKHHPEMVIVNKKGGRRTCGVKNETSEAVRYGYRYKVQTVYFLS